MSLCFVRKVQMDCQNKGKSIFVEVETLHLCSLLITQLKSLCGLNVFRLCNTEDLQTLKIKL